MTGFMQVLVAAGSCPSIPGAANVGATGAPGSASISVNPDGTITFTGNNSQANTAWYTPPIGTPGNNYFIKFVLNSGTAWTGAAAGTVLALSSGRTLAWSSTPSISASVTATFYADAGGTIVVGTTAISLSIN